MLAADGICERCKHGRLYNVVLHRCIKGSSGPEWRRDGRIAASSTAGIARAGKARFVAPSRFYIEKLVEWGFDETRFRHIPNFVAPERYSPDFSPGNTFVYVGRLSPEKGLKTLVSAAALSGCSVRIVGTGPQLEELRLLADRLSADVTFVGYLSGAALHDEVRAARAVVLPSECYENAPMSVLEAYALGKPVIGARIGGIPEADSRRTHRHICAERRFRCSRCSIAASQRSARQLKSSDLGREARRWVEQEFSASIYRERMIDLYRGLA